MPEPGEHVELSTFVGKDFLSSLQTSYRMGIRQTLPACQISSEQLYIAVVNDAGERGVKLASDFLSEAQKEQNLQNML